MLNKQRTSRIAERIRRVLVSIFGTELNGPVIVMFSLFLGIAGTVDASDSLSQSLFDAFLEGPTVPVFVSFERQILVPKRVARQTETRLKDGRSIVERTPEKDYFAFLRTTNGMVLSYSLSAAVTNVDSLALADAIYGFDSEYYWSLSRGRPMTMGGHQGSSVGAPTSSLGQLIVVPKSEMAADRQGPDPYVISSSIIEMLKVGLEVEQFGCDELISAPPYIQGSRMLFNIMNSSTTISADLDVLYFGGLPRTLQYNGANGFRKLVEITPETDTIQISQGKNGKTNTHVSYNLISFGRPEEDVLTAVSWKSYKHLANARAVILRTNHADFLAEIEGDKGLKIVKGLQTSVSSTPVELHGSIKRIFLLYALGATTLVGVIVLMRSAQRKVRTKGINNENKQTD